MNKKKRSSMRLNVMSIELNSNFRELKINIEIKHES